MAASWIQFAVCVIHPPATRPAVDKEHAACPSIETMRGLAGVSFTQPPTDNRNARLRPCLRAMIHRQPHCVTCRAVNATAQLSQVWRLRCRAFGKSGIRLTLRPSLPQMGMPHQDLWFLGCTRDTNVGASSFGVCQLLRFTKSGWKLAGHRACLKALP